jgi:diguanylate cyclase (GGDEF)-like protein
VIFEAESSSKVAVPGGLLIAVGIALAIGFSAICGWFLLRSAQADHEQARNAANNVVGSIQSEISRNIELYDLSLQAVVDGLKLPNIETVDPALRNVILFDRSATARDLGSIFVLDRDGNVLLESRSLTPRKVNYSSREYFRFHKANPRLGYYISRPWVTGRGEHVIGISRRLDNPDGSFNGVVIGTMRLGYFHRLFIRVEMGANDMLALLTADGTLLMRTPFEIEKIGLDFSKARAFTEVSASQSGYVDSVSVLDGVKRLFVYQPVGNTSLYMVAGIAHDTIFAGWTRLFWVIVTTVGALCAILMALVVFLVAALKRRAIAENKLAILANTDSLTGLSNRRTFDSAIHKEWLRSERTQVPIALLMIDADRFKAYNDLHGHQAGDAALTTIADGIAAGTKRASDLCARYGGEEFAVLLPGQTVESALRVAEGIRKTIVSLRVTQNERADAIPTISVGVVAMIPQGDLSPGDLIKAADAALYMAKRQGGNCCVNALVAHAAHNDKLVA